MATQSKGNGKFKDVEDDFGVPWKPSTAGESIEGIYCGSEMVDGGRGDPFRSYRVKDTDGIIHGVSGATLEKRMSRIPGGSIIRVTFSGTQKSKQGSDMKLFRVQVGEATTLREIWEENPNPSPEATPF